MASCFRADKRVRSELRRYNVLRLRLALNGWVGTRIRLPHPEWHNATQLCVKSEFKILAGARVRKVVLHFVHGANSQHNALYIHTCG